MTNKELVLNFYEEVFNGHDLTNLDRYLRPDYKQHSTTVANGREGFRAFAQKFLSLKPHMDILYALEEGDLVVVFFKCTLENGIVNKVFDLYRVTDGLLAEHWDSVEHDVDIAAVVAVNGNGPF